MAELVASRYELLGMLGQGAMGVVWRAHDTVLDRLVALKQLSAIPGVSAAEARDRFLVEARAAARLHHPNIVRVHDVIADGDRVLIAMELVTGETLAQLVDRAGAQPAPFVRAVMAQVADALAAAHDAGVVHRDLKPDNVFLSEGRAVVTDFGLARIGSGLGTVTGTVMGTPGYMAPEQIRGVQTGPATDVFAWGVTAQELLNGRPPFGRPSETEPIALAYRIVHEPPEPLVATDDPGLAAAVNRALSKESARRPPDGAALVTLLNEPSSADPRPATAPGRAPGQPARRGAAVWVVAGVTALVLVALVAVLLGQGGGEPVASPGRAPLTTLPFSTAAPRTVPPTTTTVAPTALPTAPGPVSAGTYVSGTEPAITFRVGDGWHLTSTGRRDLMELTLGANDRRFLSFARPEVVYSKDFVLGTDERDPPGVTTRVPGDLLQFFAEHPLLTVTDRRTEMLNGRTVASAEVNVKEGYRNNICARQSEAGTCVVIFPLVTSRFLLASGNRNRIFVMKSGDATVVAVVEAPAAQYDQFLGTARAVVSSMVVP